MEGIHKEKFPSPVSICCHLLPQRYLPQPHREKRNIHYTNQCTNQRAKRCIVMKGISGNREEGSITQG
jgi:hypothetical protein